MKFVEHLRRIRTLSSSNARLQMVSRTNLVFSYPIESLRYNSPNSKGLRGAKAAVQHVLRFLLLLVVERRNRFIFRGKAHPYNKR